MAIFEVEAPDGRIFEIEGDSEPTEQELEEIYATILKQDAPQEIAMQQPTPIEEPTIPKEPMSWGRAGIEAIKNSPASAWQMVKDIGSAIASPVKTVKSIGKLGGVS